MLLVLQCAGRGPKRVMMVQAMQRSGGAANLLWWELSPIKVKVYNVGLAMPVNPSCI